jgi:hypothetical protein
MTHRSRRAASARRRTAGAMKRLCLRCDRRFWSEGPHNRLCDPCRSALATTPSPEEEYRLGAGHLQGPDGW